MFQSKSTLNLMLKTYERLILDVRVGAPKFDQCFGACLWIPMIRLQHKTQRVDKLFNVGWTLVPAFNLILCWIVARLYLVLQGIYNYRSIKSSTLQFFELQWRTLLPTLSLDQCMSMVILEVNNGCNYNAVHTITSCATFAIPTS